MKTRTRAFLILAVLAIAWFILQMFFAYRSSEAFAALTLGWINFLERSFHEVTISWNGVAMVLICSAIAGAILRRLMGTKKSVAVFGGFWLLFILTMASSGFFTKAREVFFSDEPRLVRAISEGRRDFRNETLAVRIILDDVKDLADARRLLAQDADRSAQRMQVALFDLGSSQSEKRFVALIARREQRYLDRLGFIVAGPDYAASFPKEFLMEVGQALNRLETSGWPGDFRTFLDRNLSNRANRQRREAPGCEI